MSSVEFTWNNRVIRFVDPWGDVCYFFAEVTYDDNGKANGYSQEVCLVGDDMEELHLVLERLRTALTLPILEAKDFPEPLREYAKDLGV
jgi:hypothetical protein